MSRIHVANGFSLIEVIVAMMLLSVALLAIAGSGLFASHMLQQARIHESAVVAAASIRDSLLLGRVRGSGEVHAGVYDMQWSAADDVVVVRARLRDGSSFTLQGQR